MGCIMAYVVDANVVDANVVDANVVDANAVDANAVDTDSDDEILDTTWIEEFKQTESLYNEFYKEPVKAINIFLLYVNKDKELEYIHSDKCVLNENGLLKREIILSFIKRYQMLYTIQYKLLSLLKYNIDLEPTDIEEFAQAENNRQFMTSEKYLEDIHFKDSIHMFQDLNALFFLFYEEKTASLQTTRKVKLIQTKHHKTKRTIPNSKNLKIKKHLS